MWKDFFYYSKSERIAVYVLSLLIVVFMIGSIVLPYYLEEPIENMAEIEERVQFTDSIREKERLRTSRRLIPEKRHVVLKEFDPNTADSIDFLNLGLPPFMASNILKYRAKGGSFSTPESFARIYGMTEERFAQLRPYIKIADREEAVRKAVRMSCDGDIVLFAGKGHETYQLICGEKVPFVEREIIEDECDRILSE